jgi:hypothetical protein
MIKNAPADERQQLEMEIAEAEGDKVKLTKLQKLKLKIA